MASITRFSIVTLVFFILSIVFVIYPVKIKIRRKRIPHIPINLTTAPILAIAILWASQCLGPTQIRDGIVGTEGVKPYNILILFFSLAYMAITLDISGVLQAAAFWVSNKGGTNGRRLYFYFYILLTVVSVLIGNDPVILSGTVFLVYYTRGVDLEPLPWLIAEFASANTASMVLVVGNPTNVVVCEGFGINFAAFTLYTVLAFLACSVVCYFALAFQFRDKKHIPREMKPIEKLDVRQAIRDPVSACVGSALLFGCVVVIMVVSFFKVDVWKVSLPFAGAKFIFDLVWDYVRPKPPAEEPKLEGDTPVEDDITFNMQRAMTMQSTIGRQPTFTSADPTLMTESQTLPGSPSQSGSLLQRLQCRLTSVHTSLSLQFPTFFTALPRLPFALVPFAFSQFILIEALAHQGWIDVFAHWLVRASHGRIYPAVWLVGVLGVILCNIAGTNIGATILLTKIVRAAALPPDTTRAAGVALAVASNIGAVSFTFSASLAGLLWKTILKQKQEEIAEDEAEKLAHAKRTKKDLEPGSFQFSKRLEITQGVFAWWNLLPLSVMTAVGLAVVSAEMAVLY
ncbi:Arsenical pump membrane protein [Mycena venus]|uniref:Arsenical pump membrane protein n=1 Tax=Mycena venus TaxID=2733690 RepID=A0A8H7CPH4_9AGAR|nr:Arsenical pump membrane protein [Mycena venus]